MTSAVSRAEAPLLAPGREGMDQERLASRPVDRELQAGEVAGVFVAEVCNEIGEAAGRAEVAPLLLVKPPRHVGPRKHFNGRVLRDLRIGEDLLAIGAALGDLLLAYRAGLNSAAQ